MTLPETDTTVADGAVTQVSPDEGTNVPPEATVSYLRNPTESRTSTRSPLCEVGFRQPDPGNPPSDGEGAYAEWRLAPEGAYHPILNNPSDVSVSSVPLRWGTKRWGWRHIRIGHGYGQTDKSQTVAALATDPTPIDGLFKKQWLYHYWFTVQVMGASIHCLRTVVVEFKEDDKAIAAGRSGIRGIHNSYTGLLLPED